MRSEAPSSSEPTVPPFLLRGVARGIDVIAHLVLAELAFRASAVLPPDGWVSVSEGAVIYVDVAVGALAFVLTATVSEALGGATLGKAVTGLRIARADGDPAPVAWLGAFVRNVGFLVDQLFFGMVAYSQMAKSRRRRRVGDVWGGTVVVWFRDAPQRSALRGWPLGLSVGFLCLWLSYLVTG